MRVILICVVSNEVCAPAGRNPAVPRIEAKPVEYWTPATRTKLETESEGPMAGTGEMMVTVGTVTMKVEVRTDENWPSGLKTVTLRKPLAALVDILRLAWKESFEIHVIESTATPPPDTATEAVRTLQFWKLAPCTTKARVGRKVPSAIRGAMPPEATAAPGTYSP